MALLYRIIADFLNKKIEERKKRKEEEKNKEKINEIGEIDENINVNEKKDGSDSKNNLKLI